jgi:hypothetical protein
MLMQHAQQHLAALKQTNPAAAKQAEKALAAIGNELRTQAPADANQS